MSLIQKQETIEHIKNPYTIHEKIYYNDEKIIIQILIIKIQTQICKTNS